MDKNALDGALNESLELYESGVAMPEILRLFPKFQKEISDTFSLLKILNDCKKDKDIVPPKKILAEVISQIPDATTETNRFYPSHGNKILLFLGQWRAAIPVGAIILIIAAVLLSSRFTKMPTGTNIYESQRVVSSPKTSKLAAIKEGAEKNKKIHAPQLGLLLRHPRTKPRDVGLSG